MSRKLSIQIKKQWLQKFEEGKTETQIAREEKRDVRTIVKGISEASRAKHLANAEIEMLRDALRKHQDKLITVLNGIAQMLVTLPDQLPLNEDEQGRMEPTPIAGALLTLQGNQIVLKIHAEETLEWEMLHQHLKSFDIWKNLRDWQKALTAYIQDRWELKQWIKKELQTRTYLSFKAPGKEGEEYLLSQTTDLFYEVGTRRVLGVPDKTGIENGVISTGKGTVMFGSTELARCKDAAKCRAQILSVFMALPRNQIAVRMKSDYAKLAMITSKARRLADEILLMGMITGKCRVCQRLGK